MNAPAPRYTADRVNQSGSVILQAWKAEREAEREAARNTPQAAVPISTVTPGTDMYDILTGGFAGSGAGVPVTEQSIMAVGAAYACVGLIGGALAALPFHLYKRSVDGRERYENDIWWLFNESPCPAHTASSAWQYAAQSIGLKGDGFWRIKRVTPWTNTIEAFIPHHPDRVHVVQEDGRNYYQVQNDKGTIEIVDQDDMLHFTGIGFDGKRSISPIRAALRPAGGIALAADEYASAFFKNGARPDFALTTPGKLDPEAANLLRTTWASRHGGPSNAHLPAILAGGLDVKQLTMSAEDAQLLTTRKFQVEDIARIFGVPPHMIGYTEKASSWGSGVEQMSIGFVRYTLRRYLDSIKQEINRKVWPRSRLYFGEHDTDSLLEGDAKAQAEYFAKALGGPGSQGWQALNEVRIRKNLKPIKEAWADTVQRSGSAVTVPDTASEPDTTDPEQPTENADAPDAQTAGQ